MSKDRSSLQIQAFQSFISLYISEGQISFLHILLLFHANLTGSLPRETAASAPATATEYCM